MKWLSGSIICITGVPICTGFESIVNTSKVLRSQSELQVDSVDYGTCTVSVANDGTDQLSGSAACNCFQLIFQTLFGLRTFIVPELFVPIYNFLREDLAPSVTTVLLRPSVQH